MMCLGCGVLVRVCLRCMVHSQVCKYSHSNMLVLVWRRERALFIQKVYVFRISLKTFISGICNGLSGGGCVSFKENGDDSGSMGDGVILRLDNNA